MNLKPLYKLWNNICQERKVMPLLIELTDDDKIEIYNRIKSAMLRYETELYIDRYDNPYQIKKWLEEEHHLQCSVLEKQMVNGQRNSYKDTHYCYITW